MDYIVYVVAESRTRLSNSHFHFYYGPSVLQLGFFGGGAGGDFCFFFPLGFKVDVWV